VGISNPKPPWRIQRGGAPSFKDLQDFDGGKVEIAPRARFGERSSEAA